MLCSLSDDLETIKLVHAAHPDYIRVRDRQGRTCLHLAVLAVGKDQSKAVEREEHEARETRRLEKSKQKATGGGGGKAAVGGGEEDGDYEEEDNSGGIEYGESYHSSSSSSSSSSLLLEEKGRSRAVVRWLISMWPEALLWKNNFDSTPTETVLEKTKAVKSKFKTVQVYGLYDDPPTARILLTSQKYFSAIKRMPGFSLRPLYSKALFELNWIARRDAMLLSYAGEPRPFAVGATCTAVSYSASAKSAKSSAAAAKSKPAKKHGGGGGSGGGGGGKGSKEIPIHPRNLLARFRREGNVDVIRIVMEFI